MPSNTAPKPCYLLKLPAELQDRIYEFVLIEEGSFDMVTWATSRPNNQYVMFYVEGMQDFASEPGLLVTCKEIREAALPIFYRRNIFTAHPALADAWQTWLLKLTPQKRSMVECVRLHSHRTARRLNPYRSATAEEARTTLRKAWEWVVKKGLELKKNALYADVGNGWINDAKFGRNDDGTQDTTSQSAAIDLAMLVEGLKRGRSK